MSRRRRPRARSLLRILASLVLVVVASQSSLAWALAWSAPEKDDCCAGARHHADDADKGDDEHGGNDDRNRDGDDRSRDCSCPLDCSHGCAGAFARAVPPAEVLRIHAPALAVEVCGPMPVTTPSDIDSRDILHVPKR